MSWTERDMRTMAEGTVAAAKAEDYDESKKKGMPTLKKESETGAPQFEPVKYQPIKSPGIFEAEFGVKGDDLLFHFWPHGYHLAEREERPLPAFKREFHLVLKRVMGETFDPHRIVVDEDRDMGAWFVQAVGWANHQFTRELAIKACEAIHAALGGS